MPLEARDPLADILALVRPEAVVAAEIRARGPFHLTFEGHPGVKFGVVVAGACFMALRGRAPTRLRAGDVFLLGGQPAFSVGSDLEAPPRDANLLLRRTTGRIAEIGRARGEPVVRLIGARFALDPTHAHLLVDALPPMVRIPADEASPLRAVTRLLVDEVRASDPGRTRALDQLAQLVLTYALRWLDADGRSPPRRGWLRALATPGIAAALRHIHAGMGADTSLAGLARLAGMSRTTFAARFKEVVGQPPRAYAIAWRMALAKDALRTTNRPVGALAFELGYKSESAFSAAFRRAVGVAPLRFRRMRLGTHAQRPT
ncbi:MAG: AraC family transcriptional regulator [Polyangiaceae bacterium]